MAEPPIACAGNPKIPKMSSYCHSLRLGEQSGGEVSGGQVAGAYQRHARGAMGSVANQVEYVVE